MRTPSPFQQPQGVLGSMHRRPRSAMRVIVRGIGGAFAIAVIIAGITAVIPQGPDSARPVSIDLPTEADAASAVLESSGLLRYPRTFRTVLALRGSRVQPGPYTLSPHLSVWSLARVVSTTRARPERTITIPEGWSIRDIGRYLERDSVTRIDNLYAVTGIPAVDYRSAPLALERPKDFTAAFAFLQEKPAFIGLEGYLFPDTYRVYADASAEDIVRRMLDNFDRKVTLKLRQEIVRSGRSLHQVITMASIIEAEISRHEDRPIAAGILWKRRDRGMLLQVDATVNYVTGKRDPRVSRGDSVVDSAYNTYRYPGLPRGPISNPGMSAILAALRPQPSPYWFFLTAKDGRTVFSRTLDEHNANVNRYLQSSRSSSHS